MFTIYRYVNIHNGKSYIGQTKYSLERRWKGHLHTALHKKDIDTRPFALAIRKYGKEAWIKGVLCVVPSKELANKLERRYIKQFNSYSNGYNATLGGDYFDGYIPSKGINHHATDKAMYTLYNSFGYTITGTRAELCTILKATSGAFSKLITNKLNKLKGYSTSHENASRPDKPKSRPAKIKTITPLDIFKPSFKALPQAKERLNTPIQTYITNYYRSERLKANNPTKGTSRPQYVRDAVSNRRKAEADQTLRDWYHPHHGIIYQVRSIDLRDMYNLNISHLRQITHKTKNQISHKGWRLCNTE